MKQTAVEWLMKNLHKSKDPFNKAIEIEKNQICKAYETGYSDGFDDAFISETSEFNTNGNEYYNNTYEK